MENNSINKDSKNKYSADREYILDLKFNNKDKMVVNMGGIGVLALVGSFALVTFIVMGIRIRFEPESSSFFSRNFIEIIFAGTTVLWIAVVRRSYRYEKEKRSFGKMLNRRDFIFSPISLKINPFLIWDNKTNPQMRGFFINATDAFKGVDYIEIQMSDIHTLEVIDRGHGKHREFLYVMRTNGKSYTFNRHHFGQQEHQFFDLLQAYANTEISINSNWKEPLGKVSKKDMRKFTIIMIVVLILMFTMDARR